MSIHLHRDLEHLQDSVLSLAAAVEQKIERAIRALFDRDMALAQSLIEGDREIDLEENEVEEECLKILALHQPVAVDLRRVASILKITAELERMADLAANIAERVIALIRESSAPVSPGFQKLTDLVNTMVRDSLDAFVNLDPGLAKRVCRLDDEVDECSRDIIDQAIALMKQSPANVELGLHQFSIARQLERIADHATNIAEDVVYLVDGEIIRHHPEALRSSEHHS